MQILRSLREFAPLRRVRAFFGAAPGAVRNHVNLDELARIVVTSVAAGGGVTEALRALAADIPAWVAPGDVGLATGLAVVLIEVMRRLKHGRDAAPPDDDDDRDGPGDAQPRVPRAA